MSDTCALNADGSLKDASDITFYNDPDDDVPLPLVPSDDFDSIIGKTISECLQKPIPAAPQTCSL